MIVSFTIQTKLCQSHDTMKKHVNVSKFYIHELLHLNRRIQLMVNMRIFSAPHN